nr:MAG: hypothetical protein [Microviridae sp.]
MWEIIERVILVALIFWSAYVTFIKPHIDPVSNENADSINHYTFNNGWGCARYTLPAVKSEFKKDSVSNGK